MPSLKEIRNRITSVGSTMQITSAMKMVSAAKLKRAQDAITQMRPYSEKLQEILSNLSATLDLSENAFSDSREVKNVLIVGITSNRGLCGGFNNNVIKRVTQLVNEEYKDANPRVLCLGNKSRDSYKRSDAYFIKDALEPGDYIFEPTKAEIVADLIPKSLKIQLFKGLLDSNAAEHGARMTAMHKATDNASELQRSLKLSYNKARQAAITNEILEIVGGAEALNS